MALIIRNNIGAILFSLIVHGVLIFLLVASFDWAPKTQLKVKSSNIVKAVVVDASKVQAELDKLKRADDRKQKKVKDRVAKLKREEKKLKKKRRAEEKKRKTEQANLAKLKKQQAKLKKKQAAEKKRKAKKTQLAKQKKARAKQKLDAEKKQRQKELAQQLADEEQTQANEIAQREIDKYQVLIRQRIERNWLKPSGGLESLVTVVGVRLIPGGEVIDVSVVKTSGNLVYDRNAERAVRKASPLPLPQDPAIAAKFFNFKFEFKLE